MRLRLENLTWQELDGEIVLLDLQGSAYFRLNGSGTVLWQQLAAGGQRSDLEAALIEKYGIDRDRAAADVDNLLSELVEHGLLEMS